MLQDKVAVVTGAGRGIGRAIAIGYAKAGMRVCCAARTLAEIRDATMHIKDAGGQAIPVSADVDNFESMEHLFRQTAQRFGGVDIVVIGAGISTATTSVEKSDPRDWRQDIETNLIGAYHTAKAAIPFLKSRGAGKIIIIGSGLGHRGAVERSAYSSSKAGLWMLTRILAQELHPYNISVNELIPGPVNTSITREKNAEVRARFGDSEWIKEPDEVVPLALFLAGQPDYGPTAQSFSLMRRDC